MLKFLVIFEQGYLHFHFVYLGPSDYELFLAPSQCEPVVLSKKDTGMDFVTNFV